MNKIYNTQNEIATKISDFLLKVFPNIRKSQLKIIPFITIGMILSESVVTSDIAKNLKDDFSLVQLDSVTRRIRRFFSNKLFHPYKFYEIIIKFVISNYKKKHHDKRIHIIFDHMYSKENFTILMFSLRVGKQGIPLWFRCFDGIRNPDAFFDSTIIDGIRTVVSYFNNHDYDLIFLADRWFNSQAILDYMNSINVTFNIRLKSNLKVLVFDKKEGHFLRKNIGDLFSYKYHSNFFNNVFLFDNHITKLNIVVSKSVGISDPWFIATNADPKRAIKDYAYRFGGIESLFKNQKSNGFYLEAVSNYSLKSFSSMYSILCFSTLFLTILGTDFAKNTKCYKNVKITTHKTYKNNVKKRVMSLFNTGLTLFHLAFNSPRYIRIPFHFILYDS